MKSYITFSQLAPKLAFRGKRAPEAARKWVERRSIPKVFRGNAWMVAEDDVEKSLAGHSFVRRVQLSKAS